MVKYPFIELQGIVKIQKPCVCVDVGVSISMAVSCTQGQPKWARQILSPGLVAASSSNSMGLEYLVRVFGSQDRPLWKIMGRRYCSQMS